MPGGFSLRADYEKLLDATERFLSSRFWRARIVIACYLLALFISTPYYYRLPSYINNISAFAAPIDTIQDVLLLQKNHPPESHYANASYRLTVPARLMLLGKNVLLLIVFQHFVWAAFFYLAVRLAHDISGDKATAFFTALGLAGIYFGVAGVVDLRGNYDYLAYFLLLLAMYFPNPVSVFAFILIAGWTDERAVAGSVFVYLWWAMAGADSNGNRRLLASGPLPLAVALSVAVYLASRYLISRAYALDFLFGGGISLAIFYSNINAMGLGAWSALEGFWFLLLLALLALVRKKYWGPFLLLALSVGAMVASAHFVVDVTRSASYAGLSVFVALRVLARSYDTHDLRRMTLACACVSVFFPFYYLQAYARWNFPIFVEALETVLRRVVVQ